MTRIVAGDHRTATGRRGHRVGSRPGLAHRLLGRTTWLVALALISWRPAARAEEGAHGHAAGAQAATNPEPFTPSFTIHGFADVGFSSERSDSTPSQDGFSLGQFDLCIISGIAENLSFLGEAVFEQGDDGAWGVDVERVALKYRISDHLRIVAGRTHTALG